MSRSTIKGTSQNIRWLYKILEEFRHPFQHTTSLGGLVRMPKSVEKIRFFFCIVIDDMNNENQWGGFNSILSFSSGIFCKNITVY